MGPILLKRFLSPHIPKGNAGVGGGEAGGISAVLGPALSLLSPGPRSWGV